MRARAAFVAVTSLFGAMTATAHGSGVVIVNQTPVQPADIDSAMVNHSAYLFQLVNTSGLPITAIDLWTPGNGIFGQFHQRWTYSADEEVFTSTPRGTARGLNTNAASLDSHILIPTGSDILVPGYAQQEDDNVAVSPLADSASADYGYGTAIRYEAGILGGALGSTLHVAYLVVPLNGSFDIRGNFTEVGSAIPIPFSATILAPTTVNWTGNTSNSWDTGVNWKKGVSGADQSWTDPLSFNTAVSAPARRRPTLCLARPSRSRRCRLTRPATRCRAPRSR